MSEILQGGLRQISGRHQANGGVASINSRTGIQLVLEEFISCENTGIYQYQLQKSIYCRIPLLPLTHPHSSAVATTAPFLGPPGPPSVSAANLLT